MTGHPGGKTGQCAACHEWFTSDSAFDRHRTGPYTSRACLHPADVGLVAKTRHRGDRTWQIWGWPDWDRAATVSNSAQAPERPTPVATDAPNAGGAP